MKKIILDTNVLLMPFKFKIDIYTEIDRIVFDDYELIVYDKMVKELERLIEKRRGADKLNSKMALQLATQECRIVATDSKLYADDFIVSVANKDTIVFTQDGELKNRLREKGVTLIGMRGRNHLEILDK